MPYVIATLLPCLAFFNLKRPLAGLCCVVLQLSLFGWIPAAIWACSATSRHQSIHRVHRAVMRLS